MHLIKAVLKKVLPRKAFEIRREALRIINSHSAVKPVIKRKCPICNYCGWFEAFGNPPRLDAQCGKCGSLERHRLFFLSKEKGFFDVDGSLKQPILHFAPENILEKHIREEYKDYKTADLYASADLKLNIENINITDSSIGTVIANHVLEHVDDRKALREIHRILKSDGKLVASVPIVEGWSKTYEDERITSEKDRELHFGQRDHVRRYGRDFPDRVHEAGFQTTHEITASNDEAVKYGLLPGEKIFVFEKQVTLSEA